MLLAFALTLGCGVKTRDTTYTDPDAYGAVEGTGIEARDMRSVADSMSRELLGAAAISGFEGVPRIAVATVENETRFLVDAEIITALITDALVNHAAGELAVLDGPGDADFELRGELRSLSAATHDAQSDYVLFRFQLTDLGSNVMVWSNTYEMKKEGSWGVVYQ
jgi:PBP1b-binding outer membrane lipoprotein LpoB